MVRVNEPATGSSMTYSSRAFSSSELDSLQRSCNQINSNFHHLTTSTTPRVHLLTSQVAASFTLSAASLTPAFAPSLAFSAFTSAFSALTPAFSLTGPTSNGSGDDSNLIPTFSDASFATSFTFSTPSRPLIAACEIVRSTVLAASLIVSVAVLYSTDDETKDRVAIVLVVVGVETIRRLRTKTLRADMIRSSLISRKFLMTIFERWLWELKDGFEKRSMREFDCSIPRPLYRSRPFVRQVLTCYDVVSTSICRARRWRWQPHSGSNHSSSNFTDFGGFDGNAATSYTSHGQNTRKA